MADQTLTKDPQSTVRDFWAYLQERFPPQVNGVLIFSYFTANYLLARGAVRPEGPLMLSGRFLAGCVVLLLMFFHLRVIDEHRDYEQDRIVHPDRVLSRGRVTLGQLCRLGYGGIALELVLTLALGLPALAGCLIILALSWLMYKEFYLSKKLHRHLVMNAFIHMTILPVFGLFVFAVAADDYPWTAPRAVLLFAWVSYGAGLAYELARKTRAPHDERPGLITYSSAIGPYASAYAVLAALIFSGSMNMLVGSALNFGGWYPAVIAGLLVLVSGGVLHFRLRTTTATAARLPVYAGLCIFAFEWLLAAELIRLHGLVWI